MELWREKIIAEAISWIGTPYHHQARVKRQGVDCGTLLIEVFNRCGLIPRVNPGNYSMEWHLHRSDEQYVDWVRQFADEIDSPAPADVAIFQFGRTFSHGTIVTDWPNIIHAHRAEQQVCHGDATQNPLAGRAVKFFSWRVDPSTLRQ